MKAAVYYGTGDVRLEDVPIPTIGSDEMLFEMKACGLCGSDLVDWYLKERAPLVLGHEPAGIVTKVGNMVDVFKPGDRVFVHHHVACLKCHFCIRGDFTLCEQFRHTHIEPGGFSEYLKVPAPNLQIDTLKLPDDLSFEEASLIEPVACCIRSVTKCNVQPGDSVVIIGAGPAGIIHVELTRMLGVSNIIVSDLIDYRLRAAKKFGADLVVNPKKEDLAERVNEITDQMGADVVIVTAPTVKALSTGIDVCRKGGVVCIFAPVPPDEVLYVNPHRLFFSEISIIPSYSTSHIETVRAITLINSGRIRTKDLITHRFNLNQVGEAMKAASEIKECLKIVIMNE